MISLARKRREADRSKKLEETFREADINGTGSITIEQFKKLFLMHDVVGK